MRRLGAAKEAGYGFAYNPPYALNAAAERIITADDGLTIAKKSLAAASPSEAALLRQLVAAAANAPRDITARPGGVMRVSRHSGRTPYEVLVTPLAPGEPGYGFGLSAPSAAVFVRDPDAMVLSPLDWLQRLHSLTAAEARVMQALIAGDTLDAIADRTGVAKETLRNQLKAVFAKTGTSSQAQLIRLGLRGIAAFQP